MKLMVSISPRRVTQVLVVVVLGLTLASIIGQFIEYFVGHDQLLGTETFVRLFNVDEEQNVPTWYSSSALLLCSILLMIIALAKKKAGDRYALHWSVLSPIFLFLSLDEAALIHEIRFAPVRDALNAGGFTHFTWVIPGAALVFIFVLAYLRFFFDLPAKTRILFLVAGTLLVGGAIGVEMIQGRHADLYGMRNMTYAVLTTIEELCEMLGVVVFIYALMSYLSSHMREVQVRIGDDALGRRAE